MAVFARASNLSGRLAASVARNQTLQAIVGAVAFALGLWGWNIKDARGAGRLVQQFLPDAAADHAAVSDGTGDRHPLAIERCASRRADSRRAGDIPRDSGNDHTPCATRASFANDRSHRPRRLGASNRSRVEALAERKEPIIVVRRTSRPRDARRSKAGV